MSQERSQSCNERFAIARKFHVENLQHQPLPDKVDDRVFTNVREARALAAFDREAVDGKLRPFCCWRLQKSNNKRRELARGPDLGCKVPVNNMDLAICWESPLDPVYEPPRAPHIDGSYGGSAPAVFTLVNRQESVTTVR